ncbi:hypothetical protein [Porphyromonas sp.]
MRKPVLFTAFVAVFLCLLATACGKKESSDVRPELTETRNTLKSLQEQQSELERKITALEQHIEKNNQEVARLNAEIQRTADNAKRQALEQSKAKLLSELQTLESNKQGLERTLEELKARISGIEERLARLENEVSSDKDLQAFIGKWHWDLKINEYSFDDVADQRERALSAFIFKKYAQKIIKTGSTKPNANRRGHPQSGYTPVGVELLEINIQPGGKGYVRFKNTNHHLMIGQGETFQKDFNYKYEGNGFLVITTPNVFSDLDAWFLTSPSYILKIFNLRTKEKVLAVLGQPLDLSKFGDYARFSPPYITDVSLYDWQLSSDGQSWELKSEAGSVKYKDFELLNDQLFEKYPAFGFSPKN